MQNNNAAPGSGFYEQILLIYGGKILPIWYIANIIILVDIYRHADASIKL